MVVDGMEAAETARPGTPAELAQILTEADRQGMAVIPIGGGRALGMGDPPQRFDLALSTERLDRVVEYTPADLTITVEAGVRLEKLQSELDRASQFLPLDPFGGPGHTVGGLLATAWSGPLRLRYGTARDYLVGLQVALPDGRLASSGGRVVKNVSGYDLNKLHLGACGSLGVIVEASFKLFPKPLAEETVRFETTDPEAAWDRAEDALRLPMPPVALELTHEPDRTILIGRVAGSDQGVRRIVRELGWEADRSGFWGRHQLRTAPRWARLSIRRGDLRPLIRRALPATANFVAQPGVGVVHWFDFEQDEFVAARRLTEGAGGSAVILAAAPELKRAVGAWGAPPPTLDLMRRMKVAFDPKGTLSPGRYVV